ncbi:MAG: helix-turn-helix domain-containing protein [Candidatus Adlerbacteria bacterium]
MQLKEALQTIGLSEKQTAVYLALLQLGRGSAYSIALKSGLKKPTTYVILDELIEKGLVSRVPRVKKQLYVPHSPQEVFATAEEKFALAKATLPELLALTKGTDTKVNTLYFEGVEGIKQLMEYRAKEMHGKEMVGFYATDVNADPELVRYFKDEWADKMLKLHIPVRMIAPEHASLKDYRDADAKYNRQLKTVPYAEYSSEVAIDVLGDIVRIQDYKNLQGVAIENADVAKTVRQIFELVWKKL